MKTSATQFEMMINFMEEHGDLNKPSKNPRGRIMAIKHWENLTNALNSDPTGEAKVTEKWKKVWSDLKNNTKRKAARINRALAGTGGGPALQTKLTDLEQRILRIMGPQAVTGFTGVVEAGMNMEQNDPDRTLSITPTPPAQRLCSEMFTEVVVESPTINIDLNESWNLPGTSLQCLVSTPQSPSLIPPQPDFEPVINRTACESPMQTAPLAEVPAPQGHTPTRTRRGRSTRRVLGSPRRGVRPQTHVERATEHFLRSDQEWRKLLEKKLQDEVELERERLNIRKMELENEKKWQEISATALEILNKISNSKLCRD